MIYFISQFSFNFRIPVMSWFRLVLRVSEFETHCPEFEDLFSCVKITCVRLMGFKLECYQITLFQTPQVICHIVTKSHCWFIIAVLHWPNNFFPKWYFWLNLIKYVTRFSLSVVENVFKVHPIDFWTCFLWRYLGANEFKRKSIPIPTKNHQNWCENLRYSLAPISYKNNKLSTNNKIIVCSILLLKAFYIYFLLFCNKSKFQSSFTHTERYNSYTVCISI